VGGATVTLNPARVPPGTPIRLVRR
jgi:hypothetical protein